MTSQSPANHGHPIAAAAVVGSFAFALVLVMRVAGLLAGWDAGLASGYLAQGFGVGGSGLQPDWAFPLAVVLVYTMAWLLLETPATGRRVMVLLTSLVLILALSPVLALWGVFWSPFDAGIGVAWAGICAMLWARQHPMPCELPMEQDVRGGKIIPMTQSDEKAEVVTDEEPEQRTSAKGGKKRRGRRK